MPFLTCEKFDELKCGAGDNEGGHNYDDDRWRMTWISKAEAAEKWEEEVPTNDDLLPPKDRKY